MSLDVLEDPAAKTVSHDDAVPAAPEDLLPKNQPDTQVGAEPALPSHDAAEQGRGGYGPDTWSDLKARLQQRAAQPAEAASVPVPVPTTPLVPVSRLAKARAMGAAASVRLMQLWADIVWNVQLLWRWKRPVLKARWQTAKASSFQALSLYYERASQLLLGSAAWYARKLRNDPALREQALIGGAAVAGAGVLVALGIWIWSIWPSAAPDDFGVAPPPAEMFGIIEARPDAPPRVIGGPDAGNTVLPSTAGGAQSFMFEAFAGRNSAGKLIADGVGGQNALRRLFPKGTKATRFLDFIGSYYLRAQGNSNPSNDEIIEAVRQRCTGLPLGKVFRTTTMTCTYTHGLQGGHRVLWIVAVSADNAERIADLSATARVIR